MNEPEKISDSREIIQSELRELTTTNQNLREELDTVRHKLNNELDLLTYKLDKTQSDIQDIRRDVHEINMTIDKLRYDLIDALRKSKTSETRDIISNLFPIFAITFPAFVVAGIILIAMLTS